MSIVPISQILLGSRPNTTRVAVRGSQSIDLGQLRGQVAHTIKRIYERKIHKALLVCEDSYDFVVGLLALASTGCKIILPPNAQAGTLRALAGSVDAIITDRDTAHLNSTLIIDSTGIEPGRISIESESSQIDFFTSGSTGEMKRVSKTLALLSREALTLDQLWGDRLEDALVFGTVSHQHVYGLAFKVLWPLLSGRAFAAETSGAWESLLSELTPGAMIVTSPAHLTRIAGLTPLLFDMQPRLIFTAGAPLPEASAIEVKRILGTFPIGIFGSTETGALAWRQETPGQEFWQPLPGIEVSVDEQNLLCVRSPFVAGDGHCRLSDQIKLYADGRFSFLGRADRVAKIEGKRVNLQHLESQIADLPWIEFVAVAQIDHPRNALGAVVTLTKAGLRELEIHGKFRFERLLRRSLSQTLDPAVLPRFWQFVDQIPIDHMGKRRHQDISSLLMASK